jgi:hypothetical protein
LAGPWFDARIGQAIAASERVWRRTVRSECDEAASVTSVASVVALHLGGLAAARPPVLAPLGQGLGGGGGAVAVVVVVGMMALRMFMRSRRGGRGGRGGWGGGELPRRAANEAQRQYTPERKAGRSLAAIAETLNAEGVATRRGGRQWWPSTVRAALRGA